MGEIRATPLQALVVQGKAMDDLMFWGRTRKNEFVFNALGEGGYTLVTAS